jgi:Cdc6-like AAA superfamily ATPase
VKKMNNEAVLFVLSELKRNNGTLNDKDLYENVNKALKYVGQEMSPKEFSKLLLILETRGYIRVEGSRKNMRIIKLLKKEANMSGS